MRTIYRRLFTALAMLHSMAFAAWGQTDTSHVPPPTFYYGVFAAYGPTVELADLKIAGFVECDSAFQHGSGSIGSSGLLLELPTRWPFSVQLRPTVTWFSGTLRARIPGDRTMRNSLGELTPVLVDQVLEFSRLELSVQALAVIPAIGNRLNVQVGTALAHTLQAQQTRKQVAVSPDNLLLSGRREQTLLSGTLLGNPPVILSVGAGMSYHFPAWRSSTISPEFFVWVPLISQASEGAWRSLSLRFGAALRFGNTPSPILIPPPPVAVLPPQLNPHVETHPPEVTVRIDEYDSTEVLPLLNQVFFSDGSSDILGVYRQLTVATVDTFSNSRLFGSALDVYYHLLNIVGWRMLEMPEATLAINGYRNGRETDPQLARRRAMTIRDYLVNVWGIAPTRLKASAGKLPPSPSRENSEDGYQENARVELVPSDPNLTAPVVRRHIQRTATPPAITFIPTVDSVALLERWALAIHVEGVEGMEGEMWKQFDSTGALPDSIVWDWRNDNGKLPELPMRLGYILSAMPRGAFPWQSSDTHRIVVRYDSARHRLENRHNDTTIAIYSLLLFEYDSPRVSASDRTLLQAIGSAIGDSAKISITGYTDSLGGEAHNRGLATMRAEETAKILKPLVPSTARVSVNPNGGERERFPYNTPEGRSHCRTVVIEVRTPVSSKGS